MWFLARLSLANRSLIGLISLAILGFGIFAVPSLKQQLLPSIQPPTAVIIAPYPGASPEVVDAQVTEPIEKTLQGVQGLEQISSDSAEGIASIRTQFRFGTDMDRAVDKMQQAVNQLGTQLPQSVRPTVRTGSTDDFPAVLLAAGTSGDQQQLADKLAADVVPELRSITGVRDVRITGAGKQTVTVTLNYPQLAAAGVPPTAVISALQAAGKTVPAGSLTEANRTLTVQVGGQLESVDALRDTYLSGSGKPVRLGDVAKIDPQPASATSITRTNGKPSLGIAVMMAGDGNAVSISHAVRDKLGDLGRRAGAELTVILDQGPFIEDAISGLTSEGLLGLLFAVVVILLFLLSVRSTLVTAVSIPLSVLVALLALWSGDLSLNLLTLGALTIAVGRVVDDSIVVLENIKRHLAYGEGKQRAVLDGVREVAGAVTASTLTTVAVFLPIAFVGGLVGELFSPFAITITVALLASLLVSLTIVPVLAYWFLKPPKQGEDVDAIREAAEQKERRSVLQRAYVPVIRFATTRRLTTLLVALAILGGTLALLSRLDTNFIDDSGGNTVAITQKLTPGSSLQSRDEAAKKVEGILAATGEAESYQVTIGSEADFSGRVSAQNTFQVTMRKGTDIKAVQDRLRTQITAQQGVGEVKFGAEASGFGSSNVSVIVKAPNQDALKAATDQVRDKVAGVGGLTEVTSDLAVSAPRVQIDVNEQAAAAAGLTAETVSQLAGQAIAGFPVGEVSIAGKRQEIVLRTGTPPRDIAAIRALPLVTPAGVIPLERIADIRTVDGSVLVTRIDSDRSATVTAKPVGKDLGAVNQELDTALGSLTLTGGATYTIGGVSAEQQEAFGDLGLALLAAIVIVFSIMVATFRSFVQPLILLVSIPFAATGAFGLLLITGTPLGLPAMIGLLMLVGIVVTNAIVLIDLVNQYRKQGMSVQDAVVEGGRRRLRPILMTASATIFALAPMALGVTGEGAFIGKPLALVVIGGLVSSTLLTLVLVPTLYTMVEGVKERTRARRAARRAPAPELVPAGV
ncbi:HAE1 family hydrophobic/amphiphilic exporter-1 [Kibdelosporangium banguiense]|uniref:HAE1 family hydrophobic/amphiphilic exporter-1 n=1 Tax=Kibdelosporangium banguiense TaxID=1365924 RepID=A0ABS4U402_9PSEU|nr:efflux RND transporter permease subunit [Kibdelosporangium banguiense]MBP2330920.1 HAE1 family hydrophobic/amphiphilic exporter-1 [Kibdelosporangium banguiense]